MGNLFLKVIDLSVDASFIILFVLLVRVLLKRFPKIFSYVLWSVVFLRLVFSFSIESPYSIMGVKDRVVENVVSEEFQFTSSRTLENYIDENVETTNNNYESPQVIYESKLSEVKEIEKFNIFPIIWIVGIGVLTIHSIYSTGKLSRKLKNSKHLEGNVYINENIETAFVFGIINPKIYRPKGLSVKEEEYILEHERVHLKRGDHIWKFLAFFITVIHWFNPLVWISYYLMSVDMELSCDEAVVRKLGTDVKKDYSASLLSFSTGRKILTASPIAFGEGNLKNRIQNILKYRKPKFWVLGICLILVLGTIVGCLTNKSGMSEEDYAIQYLKELVKPYDESNLAIEDFEITKLEYKESLDYIMDFPLELWEMDVKYKLKETGIGLEFWERRLGDEPLYLVFSRENGDLKFYGNSSFDTSPNNSVFDREMGLRKFLERTKVIPVTYSNGKHGMVNITINGVSSTSGVMGRLLLSKPIRQDDTGIWVVERELDSFGREWLPNFTAGNKNLQSMDNYKILQEKVDNGEELWRTDLQKVAEEYVSNYFGPVDAFKIEVINDVEIKDFLDPTINKTFGYFHSINLKDDDPLFNNIRYYEAIIVRPEDKEEINSSDLYAEKEMQNGYYVRYIDNSLYPENTLNSVPLSDNTVYKILDHKDPTKEKIKVSGEEFELEMNSRKNKTFMYITRKGMEVLEVEEVYLP